MAVPSGVGNGMATQAQLQTRLDAYRAAETKILEGAQRVSIGSRSYDRAALADIRAEIRGLENRLARLENSAGGRAQISFGGG